jgi:hypothetical protein
VFIRPLGSRRDREIDLAGRDISGHDCISGHYWLFCPGSTSIFPLRDARPEPAAEVTKADLAVGIVQIAFHLIRTRKGDTNNSSMLVPASSSFRFAPAKFSGSCTVPIRLACVGPSPPSG